MIYLASPYSHLDPRVREARFEAACRVAAELIRAGHSVISPIAHFHPIAKYGLPTGWEFWQRIDIELLKCCDELVVLMLNGWEASVGVRAEMRMAQHLGKPIRYELRTKPPHQIDENSA